MFHTTEFYLKDCTWVVFISLLVDGVFEQYFKEIHQLHMIYPQEGKQQYLVFSTRSVPTSRDN